MNRSDGDVLTEWGRRASRVYDATNAERYRQHDDQLPESAPSMALAAWLARVCRTCGRDLAVLDVGCGTGRYFWALEGVRELVGLDASSAMLERARQPYAARQICVPQITLVHGDVATATFESARFDLVYSIGVLAEYTPLTEAVVARIAEWLKPGGRFAFTAVRPDSPTVRLTMRRRIGRSLARWAQGPIARACRRRLLSGGLYADDAWIREILARNFEIESLNDFQSESHVHGLCVARRLGPV
jgi:SAM-dependent methyltransferase